MLEELLASVVFMFRIKVDGEVRDATFERDEESDSHAAYVCRGLSLLDEMTINVYFGPDGSRSRCDLTISAYDSARESESANIELVAYL